MRVFFPGLDDAELEAAVRRHLASAVELLTGDQLPDPPDHEWIVSGRPQPEWLTASPRLRGIVIPFAGLPATTRDLMLEHPDLAVYNLHHNAAPTAELALALLLAAAKSVPSVDRALRRGDWGDRYGTSNAILLADTTALIVGYGAVGKRIGDALAAMGMHVTAIRRRAGAASSSDSATASSGTPISSESTTSTPRPGAAVSEPTAPGSPAAIYGPEALPELLPTAHVVVIAVPLTPETKGMIGERELSLLPERALLVNIGRGPIVDEAALFAALKDGRLGGAGIDVWYRYPKSEDEVRNTFPSEFPFHELDNVVLSPHRGGDTRETEDLRGAHLAELLNTLARGESPATRIDVTAGY
ncbi:MAG: NAD(P)-dependent oxidoreductase [Candidatus Eisenbacteria bacterium]